MGQTNELPSPDCVDETCCPGGVCPLCHERTDDDGDCGHCANCGERLCVHPDAPEGDSCLGEPLSTVQAMTELETALAERGTDDYEGPDKIISKSIRLLVILRLWSLPDHGSTKRGNFREDWTTRKL